MIKQSAQKARAEQTAARAKPGPISAIEQQIARKKLELARLQQKLEMLKKQQGK